MSYYDDLSAGSSDENSSSDDESDVDEGSVCGNEIDSYLWSRSILHLDIDCFYCQCEEIDRNLRGLKPPRPLAIGQKHIIVTCNYEARKYGVKKLQLREKALAACPDLWIVEGSDLQHYRRYARSVYEAFRLALKEIASELFSRDLQQTSTTSIPARKGTMDEMIADLTPAVNRIIENEQNGAAFAVDKEQCLYVFGETATSSTAVLVEDQTGQQAIVSFDGSRHSNTLPVSRRNVHEAFGTEQDRQLCIRRLIIASRLVARVCKRILDETGLHTTGGISVSPLLAKLASDLNKPKSINIFYPWRSSHLMYAMPLRKMQNVGHRTMRALEEGCMLPSSSNGRKEMKTVRDLLELPRDLIVRSFEGLQAFQASSEEQCDLLLRRCRGLDTSEIVDDEGGLPKTVSVENSFRRGTVRNLDSVWRALDDLFLRLPRLLEDRTSWALHPDRAFPTTIRLTVRMVDPRLLHKRRPFVTRSKQASVDGKALIQEKDQQNRSLLLKRHVTPLLRQLLAPSETKDINVTRLNIAVTNFQDVVRQTPETLSGQALLSASMQPKRLNPYSRKESQTSSQSVTKKSRLATNHSSQTIESTFSHIGGELNPKASISHVSPQNKVLPLSNSPKAHHVVKNAERHSQQGKLSRPSKMKATRIDHFFYKKK